MEKLKRISAALIALTMACGIMTSCGDETTDDDTAETTTTTAAEDDADAESTAEDESTADDTTTEEVDFTPYHEFTGYDAFLMFGDSQWLWGNWEGTGIVHAADWEGDLEEDPKNFGYGIDADIVGDGEYTVAITKTSIVGQEGFTNPNVSLDGTVPAMGATGTVVFCIDINGLMDGTEVSGLDEDTGEWVNTAVEEGDISLDDDASLNNQYDITAVGDYKASDITCHVTSIKCDGTEIEFDESKFRYGNIEDNNNRYRIEIYNSYGTTATDYGIDPLSLAFEESLEVTFTIEGLGDIKTFPEVEPWGDSTISTESIAEEATESVAEETADSEEETAAE